MGTVGISRLVYLRFGSLATCSISRHRCRQLSDRFKLRLFFASADSHSKWPTFRHCNNRSGNRSGR